MGIALDVGLTSRPNYPPHALIKQTQNSHGRGVVENLTAPLSSVDILVLILIAVIAHGMVSAQPRH